MAKERGAIIAIGEWVLREANSGSPTAAERELRYSPTSTRSPFDTESAPSSGPVGSRTTA